MVPSLILASQEVPHGIDDRVDRLAFRNLSEKPDAPL